MRLPDFICVGPGRTGTTWLHAVLNGRVGLPSRIKETRFWGAFYYKGIDWYAANFRDCDPSRPCGEISPYFPVREARERIARVLPNCKIIVTLRDPVERSYSQYRLFRNRAVMHYNFETALAKFPRIVESNRYSYHLKEWIDLFGRENVHVGVYDELRAEPQAFLDRICGFIGIPKIDLGSTRVRSRDINSDQRMARNEFVARRADRMLEWMYRRSFYRGINLVECTFLYNLFFGGGKPYPRLSPEVEERVRKRLLPEIEFTEALIGFNLSAWKRNQRPASAATGSLETAGRLEPATID